MVERAASQSCHPPQPRGTVGDSGVSYRLESDLVEDLIENLSSLFSALQGLLSEFDYSRGRADVVAVESDGVVLAFEAKLTRWRDALHQAYRNRCFAHRSYVALPAEAAQRALRFEQEFLDREVGLLLVTPTGIERLIDPRHNDPIEQWLTTRALQAALQNPAVSVSLGS